MTIVQIYQYVRIYMNNIADNNDIEVIMPITIDKYSGYVIKNKKGVKKLSGVFHDSNKREIRKCFDTYDEAFEWVKGKNEEEGNIRVKNIIYKRNGLYECNTTGNILFMFDECDLELVHAFTWTSGSSHGYIEATIPDQHPRKSVLFHHMVMGKPPDKMEVDHIDRNRRNNRRNNLRFVSSTINKLNQTRKTESGIVGVHYNKKMNAWRTSVQINKKTIQKRFYVGTHGYDEAKRLAIEFRQKMTSEIEDYVIAYCMNK